MNNIISITDGIYITIISMVIVFTILLVIALILSSFKHIFKDEKSLNKDELALTNEDDDEEKIVAALAASIMARRENPNLRVKSIKRIR